MRIVADQMMAKTTLAALPTGDAAVMAVATTTTAIKTTGKKTGV